MHPGERAWLFLPVIYVYGVPILPLPILDVPLKPQKTGLLVTTPAHSAQNGWQVTQPVYFALASNWDLTVSPGYTWGSTTPPVPGAAVLGVKGWSLDTETRWVASRESRGDIELFLLNDRLPIRDVRALTYLRPVPGIGPGDVDRPADLRGSLNGGVVQALGGPWSARLDLNIVSDAALVKDTTTDVTQQANQYLRSSALVTRRTPDSLLSFLVTARQDTAWGGFSLFEDNVWPYPLEGLDPHQDNSPRVHRLQPRVSVWRLEPRAVAPRPGDLAEPAHHPPGPAVASAGRAPLLVVLCATSPDSRRSTATRATRAWTGSTRSTPTRLAPTGAGRPGRERQPAPRIRSLWATPASTWTT